MGMTGQNVPVLPVISRKVRSGFRTTTGLVDFGGEIVGENRYVSAEEFLPPS